MVKFKTTLPTNMPIMLAIRHHQAHSGISRSEIPLLATVCILHGVIFNVLCPPLTLNTQRTLILHIGSHLQISHIVFQASLLSIWLPQDELVDISSQSPSTALYTSVQNLTPCLVTNHPLLRDTSVQSRVTRILMCHLRYSTPFSLLHFQSSTASDMPLRSEVPWNPHQIDL
jgi:hypothetical protein